MPGKSRRAFSDGNEPLAGDLPTAAFVTDRRYGVALPDRVSDVLLEHDRAIPSVVTGKLGTTQEHTFACSSCVRPTIIAMRCDQEIATVADCFRIT